MEIAAIFYMIGLRYRNFHVMKGYLNAIRFSVAQPAWSKIEVTSVIKINTLSKMK